MITQSDRDVPIMAHLRAVTKERVRLEAERRKISMSALVSELVEKGLDEVEKEELEFKRSNMRTRLNNGEVVTILPAVPSHQHIIGEDGRPLCGCKYEVDVPLPLEGDK